jgi:hypothetical protein
LSIVELFLKELGLKYIHGGTFPPKKIHPTNLLIQTINIIGQLFFLTLQVIDHGFVGFHHEPGMCCIRISGGYAAEISAHLANALI